MDSATYNKADRDLRACLRLRNLKNTQLFRNERGSTMNDERLKIVRRIQLRFYFTRNA